MSTFAEFLSMGGYAGYVWPAYGLALLIIGGLIIQSTLDYRRQKRLAAQLEEANEVVGRRRAPAKNVPS